MKNYLNFDLQILAEQSSFRARVVESPAGSAAAAFDFPFTESEFAGYRKLLQVSGTEVTQSQDAGTRLRELGGMLYDAVFRDEIHTCFKRGLDAARRADSGLRLRLRLTEVPQLTNLPWEYLYDRRSDTFLALSLETPVVRFLEMPEPVAPLTVNPPLRLLAVISQPYDLPPLNGDEEWASLQQALGDLIAQGLLTVERLPRATVDQLLQHLRRQEYHLLHFIGHGGFDSDHGQGWIAFENDERLSDKVPEHTLRTLLRDEGDLRLAVLNACHGSDGSADQSFAGTAQSLVQHGVPAVIAMRSDISDETAVRFSRAFYRSLALGFPVDAAVTESRKAVFANDESHEWGKIVLFMRADDGQILTVAPEKDSERAGEDQPPPDKDGFFQKLGFWLGIAASIATLIGLVWTIWGPFGAADSAKIYGVVQYDCPAGKPVAGAEISIKDAANSDELLNKGKTRTDGSFDIHVARAPETSVWMEICKDGIVGLAAAKRLMSAGCLPFDAARRTPCPK